MSDTMPITQNGKSIIHTVKKGETLWSISRDYGVSTSDIVSLNSGITDQNKDHIAIGQKIQISENQEFNILLMPFADWGKKNDARFVADSLIKLAPRKITANSIEYSVNISKELTAVNTRSVDNNIAKILQPNQQQNIDLIIGLGIARDEGSLRFETGSDKLAENKMQYDISGNFISTTTFQSIKSTAAWLGKKKIYNIVKDINYLPKSQKNKFNTDRISTDAGDYLCEYMTYKFASSPEISGKAFFVHIGNFEGLEDEKIVLQRNKEVNGLISFIKKIAPILIENRG